MQLTPISAHIMSISRSSSRLIRFPGPVWPRSALDSQFDVRALLPNAALDCQLRRSSDRSAELSDANGSNNKCNAANPDTGNEPGSFRGFENRFP
jgi:hypothetical protein